jgi:WD40 repeat protein
LLVGLGEGFRRKRKQDVAFVDFRQHPSQSVVKSLAVSPEVGEHDFGTARALAASPATKTIAIGFNRGVALWRTDALDQPAIWIQNAEGSSGVNEITDSLSFSPDGKYLAVSLHGGEVAVWNLSEEEPKLVNNPHPDAGTYVALFSDKLNRRDGTYLVTAKRNGEMTLWDIWNPAIWVRSFKPGISALIAVGDTGMVATGSSDGLLASWYMGRQSRLRQSLAGIESPRAFAFARSSGLLYAASDAKREGDSGSRLWREEGGHYKELSPGETRPEFPPGEFGLQLLFDESSEYIALRDVYGGRSNEIRVPIKHTPSAPRAVSLDGRTLAVGNSARPWNISEVEPTSIVVWDISNKDHPRNLGSLDFDGRPVSLCFGDDGTTLAASYDNGRIVVWDYIKGTKRRQLLAPEAYDSEGGRKHSAGRVALSPDGRLLAAKSNGPVSLWDVETGLLLGRLGPESYPFHLGDTYPSDSIVFSRDGKSLLVSAGYGGGIDLWNLDPEAWATMASNITGRR